MNEKLIKCAKILAPIVKVIGELVRALSIVLLIFAVLVIIFGSKMYDLSSTSLSLGFISLYLAEGYQMITPPVIVYTVISLVAGSAVSYMAFWGSKVLRNILLPMTEGRPFESDVPRDLRKLAWLFLAGGALMEGVNVAEQVMTGVFFPLNEIFASDMVSKVVCSYEADFGFLIPFAALMFLSYIFDYGKELQKQSDETL